MTVPGTKPQPEGAAAEAVPPVACSPLTVHFDGSCPLCRREMAVYQRAQPLVPLAFADISDPAQPVPLGATREQLLARLHVQRPDGQWLSGASAFLALWAALPGWRWLAVLRHVPGMPWALEKAYRFFLRFRPSLQRLARRAEATPPNSIQQNDQAP